MGMSIRSDSSIPNDPKDTPASANDEPKSEIIPGRDLGGVSYGATEREQTRDLRFRQPGPETVFGEGVLDEERQEPDVDE
jgi:hypothetical protein